MRGIGWLGLGMPHSACMRSGTASRPGLPADGTLAWAGGDGSPAPWYPPRRFDHLMVPATGSCADPVDYAALQLLLAMFCKAD